MNINEKKEREKVIGIAKLGREQKIVVTHITIRQSIFFLIIKLFAIEILAAISLIYYLTNIWPSEIIEQFGLRTFLLPIFVIAVMVKTFFTAFIIIQWLEEYYEIKPNSITHRNGFLFKREESYKLDHMGLMEIDQSILGRFFNYGTIRLFNWSLNKGFYLYLIHNPLKYNKILEDLLPDADTQRKVFRQKVIDDEDT